MLPILVLALVVWPFVEVLVALQVADAVGILPTVGALVLLSFLGTVLLRRQGTSAMARMRAAWRAGRLPAPELVDGAVGVTGAVLLMVPGFVSAAMGILLLLPPVRFAVRRIALGRMERRLVVVRRRRLRTPRADVVTIDVMAGSGPGATSVLRPDDDLEDEFFGDVLPTGLVAPVPDAPGVPLPPPTGGAAAAPSPPGPALSVPTSPVPPVSATDLPGVGEYPPGGPPRPRASAALSVPASPVPPVSATDLPGVGEYPPGGPPPPREPIALDIPDRRFRKRRGGKGKGNG